MNSPETLLQALGGEVGCCRLSREFYARVGKDPVLRPLFPGKSLRCAIEQFSAFLIQFLGGDEQQTQYRPLLSLRESHARFRITAAQRTAWLKHMRAALDGMSLDKNVRHALARFFVHSSSYVIGKESGEFSSEHKELVSRWKQQRKLDDAVAIIAFGDDDLAISLVRQFAARPSVFVGLAARMMKTARPAFIRLVVDSVEADPSLAIARFNGRTLLHHAASAGCIEVVSLILKSGVDPSIQDHGGHTALYRVANECWSAAGPELVRMLVEAGADVNACGGVTRATPLHMAARRGFVEIAQALIECGADIQARDTKGATPLRRAINCRRGDVASLLQTVGASQGSNS